MAEFFEHMIDIQRFADGGAPGGDGGAGAPGAMGEGDAAPQSRRAQLRAAAEAESAAYYAARDGQAAAVRQEQAQEQPAEETFDDLIKGKYKADFDARTQDIVKRRVAKLKGAADAFERSRPILDMLGERYGIDTSDPDNIDYDALANQLGYDRRMYEEEALEQGVPVDLYMKQKQVEREQRRLDEQRLAESERAQAQAEYASLLQQATVFKAANPDFDLDVEMQNPAFGRMVLQPPRGSGLPVETAYYAVHHNEIEQARARQQMQVTQYAVSQTKSKVANAIASGSVRPTENGASGAGASYANFDPRSLTKEQRADIRRRVRNGERITF